MSGYYAKKRFGQNFLKSQDIIQKIIDVVHPQEQDRIIEIGAGRGAITLPLAESHATITAIEFDNDLIGYLTKLLSKFPNVEIIHQDFLQYEPDFKNYILVGNLPYNITTPVIEWVCKRYNDIQAGFFMTQKEVALRLSAQPASKDWSPLAIFTQLYFDVELLFHIAPKYFSPPPKVESSLVRLLPRQNINIRYPAIFEQIVRTAFSQRRKTLLNNLTLSLVPKSDKTISILQECGLSEKVRAEQISLENFLKLTNLFVLRNILPYKN